MSASPKCPRCGAAVTGGADDLGFLSCGGCGARLRKAPTVKLTIQSPTPTSGAAPVPAASAPPPTLSGNRDTDSTDSLLARIERVDASATLPPGLQSNQMLKAAGYAPPDLPKDAQKQKDEGLDGLKTILQAIQKDLAIIKKDHQDLAAVVARLGAPAAVTATLPPGAPRPKTAPSSLRPLLIVDDDAALAEETRKACEKLGFAPLVVSAVRAALDAMGRERPALLILEPLLAGELSGKDLVNYVKSTMEWIEIPILIHTRAPIANHEQARTDFGADDYVIKGAGSVDLLAKKAARLTA
ncbi:MAG: response regulator [Vicinamibacteria bacterium]|nr:response regulator [Vicinamibacteria bacterium]